MTELVLTPAACYPVYPAIAARGPLPAGGVTVDAGGAWVFRHEPSGDPARLQMFHQREIVRIGEPETVLAWRDAWRERGARAAARARPERSSSTSPPTRSSGAAAGCSPPASATQELKFEVLVQIAGPEPTAVASFNYHQDHFASTYGTRARRRQPRAHRLPRLRPGADRARAAAHARARCRRVAGRGAQRAVGSDEHATATDRLVSLLGLDPASYQPHPLHAPERTYAETNCYTDILIELLHARGDEPLAALGCTVRMDFEGDQWTFFKPPPEDLEPLFGIDIHEMQPYRPLPEQIAEQIDQGRTIIVELDSWYLPDTAATSYRAEHVKTSVAAEAIDPEGERLRYFHGTGLYELDGEDYRGVFRLGRRLLRGRAAALHRARALRRRHGLAGRGAARRRAASCCAGTSSAARDQPVRALRRAARA